MISSYGDRKSYQRIIIYIIIVLHNAASIALNASQEHLMFYTCNYNIRVTFIEMVLLNIFYTNQITEGSSADCSLFILSLRTLIFHLAVKNITSNLSV